MDRRTVLAFATIGPLGASAALAQTKTGRDHELQHAADTLSQGSAALEASRVALERSSNEDVRRFAKFEVDEQETVAAALGGLTEKQHRNAPPAKPKLDQKGTLDKLRSLQGAEFDKAYISDQLSGHQRLLELQERYLEKGQDETVRPVAMLIRGHVKEHLAMLQEIQKRMGA